jgi:3-isopropylmalate/(R)-2-methylmalate dehydratase small subunit
MPSASATAPTIPYPKGPIRHWSGRGVAVGGDDIDTDRVIPARFLKCVSFEGLAEGAFADDRKERAGAHPFDLPQHLGASILVVNRNFGCGSSREHAPQALMRWGIRVVIGESFSEIFFGNCLAMGIPCLSASHEEVLQLQEWIRTHPDQELELDLQALLLRPAKDQQEPQRWNLSLDGGPHTMLLSGQWDATGQLLAQDAALRATAERLPYLRRFSP